MATSCGVPTRIAPPVPVYGPSVPSRTTTKSMSGLPASGLLTPGYSRDGRRLTWWSSANRNAAADRVRARRWAPTDRRWRPAGSRRGRAVRRRHRRAASRPSRGSAARRGRSSVFSTPGNTTSSTLTASPITSGPMPSPAMTASFMTDPPLPASLAPTASAIAARTSAGTSRSRRSMIVAPGPSASWLSCAAWMLTPAAPSRVPILPSAPGWSV